MTRETCDCITEFIRTSDLSRNDQKLDGLRRAFIKRHRLDLVGDMLLLDGVAIDPSELESGCWL